MMLEQFGCKELNVEEMQHIQGGGFLADLVTVAKVGYSLTKGFAVNIPLAGPLAVSLLSSFVDPVVNAA